MKFICDITQEIWLVVEEENEDSFQVDVKIGFRDNGSLPVEFDNLSFGYKIFKLDGELLFEQSFPVREDIKYISTDLDYVQANLHGPLLPDEDYQIHLWAVNSERTIQEIKNIKLPIEDKPYNSWSYDSETRTWKAPTPYPRDGRMYMWDEEKMSWILLG